MTTMGEMTALLADLSGEAERQIQRPAVPQAVMEAYCRAMTSSRGRPIRLMIEEFPNGVPISGMRLELKDDSVIIAVEKRAVPEAQLVIFGHELWHEWAGHGHCGHSLGMQVAARGLTDDQPPGALQQAVEQILSSAAVRREAVRSVAARHDSPDGREEDAETFGLLFGRAARTLMIGPYAQGPVDAATAEARINAALLGNRGGRIL
ncbi:toxin [Streptomyces sp. NBC_00620]|uniref:toxin n=1 Tax=Streptomyces sp. NBC_00620 TaxID=2903666 RepID=UPI0022586CA1|nr:toxin [Streptomyces sp. NBC_00620]MCX4976525.1 toxin [Streptomyces sp. NBC_00620]